MDTEERKQALPQSRRVSRVSRKDDAQRRPSPPRAKRNSAGIEGEGASAQGAGRHSPETFPRSSESYRTAQTVRPRQVFGLVDMGSMIRALLLIAASRVANPVLLTNSFPHTAAGQLRIFAGFPFQPERYFRHLQQLAV